MNYDSSKIEIYESTCVFYVYYFQFQEIRVCSISGEVLRKITNSKQFRNMNILTAFNRYIFTFNIEYTKNLKKKNKLLYVTYIFNNVIIYFFLSVII